MFGAKERENPSYAPAGGLCSCGGAQAGLRIAAAVCRYLPNEGASGCIPHWHGHGKQHIVSISKQLHCVALAIPTSLYTVACTHLGSLSCSCQHHIAPHCNTLHMMPHLHCAGYQDCGLCATFCAGCLQLWYLLWSPRKRARLTLLHHNYLK
jgi:hypothetical protein